MSVYADEDDDAPDDPEAPSDFDIDDSDSIDSVPCPYCGKPIYERAELCPHCRSYISREDTTPRQPRWIVIGVVICLLMVLLGWLFTKPWE